jgi:hypothetical protein
MPAVGAAASGVGTTKGTGTLSLITHFAGSASRSEQ